MADSRSLIPGLVEAAAARLFLALSAARGKRIFHPDGDAYEAELQIDAPPPPGAAVAALTPGTTHRAIVRCSRGVSLPRAIPDVLGLAIRLVDVHGPGEHQDFLLITSIDAPGGHHALVPARTFSSRPYSSLLLYRIGERTLLVGALPATPIPRRGSDLEGLAAAVSAGTARFRLALATPMGRFEPIGDLRLTAPLPQRTARDLRFNPWNTGGGIRPFGPLMGLRESAYAGSQRGRHIVASTEEDGGADVRVRVSAAARG